MPQYFAPYPQQPQVIGAGFSVTAFVLAAIAVFILPIVFGVLAIVFGVLARKRGERPGALAMRLAIIGTVLGCLFGVIARML